jgi:hypothetical protein
MPFDFKKYDAKCAQMNPEELQKEWEHYTRLISGAATSTTVSGLALPLTMGVSAIGVGMAAPAIHNARKKRGIIEKHLQTHGATHNTRKRDVLGSMAFSGTIGVVTLGVGAMGADAVGQAGAEHGIGAIVNNETAIKIGIHAALDGAAMAGEEAHHNHKKEKEAKKMIAAAKQKIALAQGQGQGEKVYANQYNPGGQQYGPVHIPGTYSATGEKAAAPQQADVKYDIKYEVPPTPQYTSAPPPYSPPYFNPPTAVPIISPAPSIVSPSPQYDPRHYAPPPAQTPGPISPVSQPFSPISQPAQTPAPAYSTPTPAPSYQPQATVQNLPPFQSHVAAPGYQQPAPALMWSHVSNQWVTQESTPATTAQAQTHPASAPAQQPTAASQDYGYPFPQQPAVDRRASVYAPTPAPSAYGNQAPTPSNVLPFGWSEARDNEGKTYYYSGINVQWERPTAASAAAPTMTPQPTQPPTQDAYGYPTPAQTPGIPQPSQTPPQSFYGYPTPAQTPGFGQAPSYAYTPSRTPSISHSIQGVSYFPPPPGARDSQPAPSYTPAPGQQTPAPQYAPVATPQSYTGPYQPPATHTQPTYQQPQLPTPPPEHFQQPYYSQEQYPAQRHYSLPNPAPIPGQEKLQQGWSGPQSPPHPHAPHHAATWGTPGPAGSAQQPAMSGLVDAYGGMRI